MLTMHKTTQLAPTKQIVLFLSDLEEMRAEGLTLDQVIEEVRSDFGTIQVLDWQSPFGRNYRFIIQQLDAEGYAMLDVVNPLHIKEFTANG